MGAREPTRYQEGEDKKEEKMKDKRITRRDFLRGAAVTGAGLVAASCAPAEEKTPTMAPKDKIVVGMSRPLSGPLAVIGDSAFGLDIHVEELLLSLVLLIVPCIPCVLGVLALVTGNAHRSAPGPYPRLAFIGMVLGVLALVPSLVLFVFFVVGFIALG